MRSDIPPVRQTTEKAVRHPDSKTLLELAPFASRPKATLIIEIEERGDSYLATLPGSPGRIREKCLISRDELSQTYRSLCEMVEKVLRGDRSRYYDLAQIGYFVFCKIFASDAMRSRVRQRVMDVGNTPPIFVIVHSERFVIPWNLLYLLKPAQDEVDHSLFLGHRCIVVSDIKDPEENPTQPPPEMCPRVEVLAGYCDRLQYSRDLEIPFIRRHVNGKLSSGAANYCELPELKKKNGRACAETDQEAIGALFSRPWSIVHFACHGSNGQSPDLNYLRVRDLYPLTHAALHDEKHRFSHWPLVFLNACEMGFIDPLKFTSIVRFFLDRGARAVIAPDCKVGDLNAAHFSRSFYKFFALGQSSLMEALFKARHEVYQRYADFIGFTYTLYGQPDARLEMGTVRCEKRAADKSASLSM